MECLRAAVQSGSVAPVKLRLLPNGYSVTLPAASHAADVIPYSDNELLRNVADGVIPYSCVDLFDGAQADCDRCFFEGHIAVSVEDSRSDVGNGGNGALLRHIGQFIEEHEHNAAGDGRAAGAIPFDFGPPPPEPYERMDGEEFDSDEADTMADVANGGGTSNGNHMKCEGSSDDDANGDRLAILDDVDASAFVHLSPDGTNPLGVYKLAKTDQTYSRLVALAPTPASLDVDLDCLRQILAHSMHACDEHTLNEHMHTLVSEFWKLTASDVNDAYCVPAVEEHEESIGNLPQFRSMVHSCFDKLSADAESTPSANCFKHLRKQRLSLQKSARSTRADYATLFGECGASSSGNGKVTGEAGISEIAAIAQQSPFEIASWRQQTTLAKCRARQAASGSGAGGDEPLARIDTISIVMAAASGAQRCSTADGDAPLATGTEATPARGGGGGGGTLETRTDICLSKHQAGTYWVTLAVTTVLDDGQTIGTVQGGPALIGREQDARNYVVQYMEMITEGGRKKPKSVTRIIPGRQPQVVKVAGSMKLW